MEADVSGSDSVLVVGASRGIGLEFVRQYLAEGRTVHATARDPQAAAGLVNLTGDLTVHQLDVRNAGQITQLVERLVDRPVGVLIHNAGVNQGVDAVEMMAVNAEAPIRVTEALLAGEAIVPGTRVVLVTSQMGARRGGSAGLGLYGKSKAALNDAFRERADGWADRGLVAVVVHPGWVRTDMGGQSAPLGVEESVSGLRQLIAGLTAEHHGRFWTWEGREHPW